MSHLGDGLDALCRRAIAENERLRSNAEYAGQVLTSTADDMLNNALAIAQERDALRERVAELETENAALHELREAFDAGFVGYDKRECIVWVSEAAMNAYLAAADDARPYIRAWRAAREQKALEAAS